MTFLHSKNSGEKKNRGEDIENSPLKMCQTYTILPCKINLAFGYPKIEYHCP